MKQGLKDAVKAGFILFLIFDIPLFLIGLMLNKQVLIINFNFTTITPYIYIGLPLFGAILFFIGGYLQTKNRKKQRDKYRVLTVLNPPLITSDQVWKGEQFGVKWNVTFGIPRGSSSNEYHPYVNGPYCQICECELTNEHKQTFFGWGIKEIWQCPDETCGFNIKRPKDYLFREDEAVGKVAMRDFKNEV
jgi:hypothetical protein